MIIGQMVWLAYEIAMAIWNAWWTFGASLAVVPALIAATRFAVLSILRELLRRVAMGVLHGVLFQVALDVVVQTLQTMIGDRTAWDFSKTGFAAELGAIGGVFGGVLGTAAGRVLPKFADSWMGLVAQGTVNEFAVDQIAGALRGGDSGVGTSLLSGFIGSLGASKGRPRAAVPDLSLPDLSLPDLSLPDMSLSTRDTVGQEAEPAARNAASSPGVPDTTESVAARTSTEMTSPAVTAPSATGPAGDTAVIPGMRAETRGATSPEPLESRMTVGEDAGSERSVRPPAVTQFEQVTREGHATAEVLPGSPESANPAVVGETALAAVEAMPVEPAATQPLAHHDGEMTDVAAPAVRTSSEPAGTAPMLAPERWEDLRDTSPMRTIDTTHVEVLSSSTPTNVDRAVGHISYDHQRFVVAGQGVQEFTIRYHLALADGVDARAADSMWSNAVRAGEQWNVRHELPVSGDQFHLRMLRVDSPEQAHLSVRVLPPGGRARQLAIPVDAVPAVVLHELAGHTLGLVDAYVDPQVVLQSSASGTRVDVRSGVMSANVVDGDAELLPDHLRRIEQVALNEVDRPVDQLHLALPVPPRRTREPLEGTALASPLTSPAAEQLLVRERLLALGQVERINGAPVLGDEAFGKLLQLVPAGVTDDYDSVYTALREIADREGVRGVVKRLLGGLVARVGDDVVRMELIPQNIVVQTKDHAATSSSGGVGGWKVWGRSAAATHGAGLPKVELGPVLTAINPVVGVFPTLKGSTQRTVTRSAVEFPADTRTVDSDGGAVTISVTGQIEVTVTAADRSGAERRATGWVQDALELTYPVDALGFDVHAEEHAVTFRHGMFGFPFTVEAAAGLPHARDRVLATLPQHPVLVNALEQLFDETAFRGHGVPALTGGRSTGLVRFEHDGATHHVVVRLESRPVAVQRVGRGAVHQKIATLLGRVSGAGDSAATNAEAGIAVSATGLVAAAVPTDKLLVGGVVAGGLGRTRTVAAGTSALAQHLKSVTYEGESVLFRLRSRLHVVVDTSLPDYEAPGSTDGVIYVRVPAGDADAFEAALRVSETGIPSPLERTGEQASPVRSGLSVVHGATSAHHVLQRAMDLVDDLLSHLPAVAEHEVLQAKAVLSNLLAAPYLNARIDAGKEGAFRASFRLAEREFEIRVVTEDSGHRVVATVDKVKLELTTESRGMADVKETGTNSRAVAAEFGVRALVSERMPGGVAGIALPAVGRRWTDTELVGSGSGGATSARLTYEGPADVVESEVIYRLVLAEVLPERTGPRRFLERLRSTPPAPTLTDVQRGVLRELVPAGTTAAREPGGVRRLPADSWRQRFDDADNVTLPPGAFVPTTFDGVAQLNELVSTMLGEARTESGAGDAGRGARAVITSEDLRDHFPRLAQGGEWLVHLPVAAGQVQDRTDVVRITAVLHDPELAGTSSAYSTSIVDKSYGFVESTRGTGWSAQVGAEISVVVAAGGVRKVWARNNTNSENLVVKHTVTRSATDVHHRYRMNVTYLVEAYSWQELLGYARRPGVRSVVLDVAAGVDGWISRTKAVAGGLPQSEPSTLSGAAARTAGPATHASTEAVPRFLPHYAADSLGHMAVDGVVGAAEVNRAVRQLVRTSFPEFAPDRGGLGAPTGAMAAVSNFFGTMNEQVAFRAAVSGGRSLYLLRVPGIDRMLAEPFTAMELLEIRVTATVDNSRAIFTGIDDRQIEDSFRSQHRTTNARSRTEGWGATASSLYLFMPNGSARPAGGVFAGYDWGRKTTSADTEINALRTVDTVQNAARVAKFTAPVAFRIEAYRQVVRTELLTAITPAAVRDLVVKGDPGVPAVEPLTVDGSVELLVPDDIVTSSPRVAPPAQVTPHGLPVDSPERAIVELRGTEARAESLPGVASLRDEVRGALIAVAGQHGGSSGATVTRLLGNGTAGSNAILQFVGEDMQISKLDELLAGKHHARTLLVDNRNVTTDTYEAKIRMRVADPEFIGSRTVKRVRETQHLAEKAATTVVATDSSLTVGPKARGPAAEGVRLDAEARSGMAGAAASGVTGSVGGTRVDGTTVTDQVLHRYRATRLYDVSVRVTRRNVSSHTRSAWVTRTVAVTDGVFAVPAEAASRTGLPGPTAVVLSPQDEQHIASVRDDFAREIDEIFSRSSRTVPGPRSHVVDFGEGERGVSPEAASRLTAFANRVADVVQTAADVSAPPVAVTITGYGNGGLRGRSRAFETGGRRAEAVRDVLLSTVRSRLGLAPGVPLDDRLAITVESRGRDLPGDAVPSPEARRRVVVEIVQPRGNSNDGSPREPGESVAGAASPASLDDRLALLSAESLAEATPLMNAVEQTLSSDAQRYPHATAGLLLLHASTLLHLRTEEVADLITRHGVGEVGDAFHRLFGRPIFDDAQRTAFADLSTSTGRAAFTSWARELWNLVENQPLFTDDPAVLTERVFDHDQGYDRAITLAQEPAAGPMTQSLAITEAIAAIEPPNASSSSRALWLYGVMQAARLVPTTGSVSLARITALVTEHRTELEARSGLTLDHDLVAALGQELHDFGPVDEIAQPIDAVAAPASHAAETTTGPGGDGEASATNADVDPVHAIIRSPGYLLKASAFEARVGAWAFGSPAATVAAHTSVQRLFAVLRQAHPGVAEDEILTAFTSKDPTLTGQVGTIGSMAALDGGNVRELMTALYNGAYRSESPYGLKALLNDLVVTRDWDRAGRLGLNVEALRTQAEYLHGLPRKMLRRLMAMTAPSQAAAFDLDVFAIGNILAQSPSWVQLGLDYLGSVGARKARPGDQSWHHTARHFEGLGAGLSERELAFVRSQAVAVEAFGLDSPLSWRSGEQLFRVDPASSWYQDAHDKRGMPVVAGVSSTAARMMNALHLLNAHVQGADFTVALLGWMLPGRDHSVYEILSGVGLVTDVPGIDLTDSVKMYQNLPGFSLKQERLSSSPLAMLPHEEEYLALVKAGAAGDGFVEPGVGRVNDALQKYDDFVNAAFGAARPKSYLAQWLDVNRTTPAHILSVLSPAHFVALINYSGTAYPLINVSLRYSGLLAEVAMRHQLWALLDESIEYGIAGAQMRENAEFMAMWNSIAAEDRVRPENLRNFRAIMSGLVPNVRHEMAVHADMLKEALMLLPPVDGLVWRTESARRSWIPDRNRPVARYGEPVVRLREFNSFTRDIDFARGFLQSINGTRPHHEKILIRAVLHGGGRDISVFSFAPDEQEVLLVPGIDLVVTSRSEDNPLRVPVVWASERVPDVPDDALATLDPSGELIRALGGLAGTEVATYGDLYGLAEQIGVLHRRPAAELVLNAVLSDRSRAQAGKRVFEVAYLAVQLEGGVERLMVERLADVRRTADIARIELGVPPTERISVVHLVRLVELLDGPSVEVGAADLNKLVDTVSELKTPGRPVEMHLLRRNWRFRNWETRSDDSAVPPEQATWIENPVPAAAGAGGVSSADFGEVDDDWWSSSSIDDVLNP